ncbi:MAG: hypothetical protein FJX65_01290 [Alphaproteobacteria bacterium]|nr:hypothetical protein [Alphaproteobacteria bacterium]
MAKAALGPIIGATITSADVDKASAPYAKDLAYKVLDRGTIGAHQATVWACPAQAGARFLVMGPASGERQFIRFVEVPPVPGYRAMTTYGWHSLEITVEDVDAIPPKLKGSQFKIIGDPHDLGVGSNASAPKGSLIRAMQVVGLAEDVLYLTQIPTDGRRPHLPNAKTFIDRIFIVPLGSPNMDRTRDWYIEKFANVEKGVEARGFALKLLNDALGVPADTKTSICTVKFPGQTLIEIDDYPPAAKPRPRHVNSLPPGIATISFAVDSLDRVGLPFVAPPRVVAEGPHRGKRVGVVVGSATELLELVQE